MEVNSPAVIEDGDTTQKAPSSGSLLKETDVNSVVKRKRRRGKTKRKIMKPFNKKTWQERRRNEKPKRDNRYRSVGMATYAPFNNNQFLMEIHKPEQENKSFQTPSGRTRDSSFSVDSDENYLFSLPEDEEDFLTKEFSSVYEDAQSERLANMSKNELIQEYLLLEAKYDNLIKRTDRYRVKVYPGSDKESTSDSERDILLTDKESLVTDKDTTGTSIGSTAVDDSVQEYISRLKEQEDQIRELKQANDKLKTENEHLRLKSHCSSSEDSESDSSSTSISSSSSSSKAESPLRINNGPVTVNGQANGHNGIPVENGTSEEPHSPLINGFGDHQNNDLEIN